MNGSDPWGLCETEVGGVVYTWHYSNGSSSCSADSNALDSAIHTYWGAGAGDILVVGNGSSEGGANSAGGATFGSSNGNGSLGFGDGSGGSSAAWPQNTNPGCNTVLPNGQTVGQVVQHAIARINVMTGPDGSSPLNLLPAFYETVRSNGPIDFKNNFRGQGNATSLAAAGNFAYGAIASGIGLSQSFAEFGAGAYAAKNFKANFGNPFGEDNSAAQNLPAGHASNGCSVGK